MSHRKYFYFFIPLFGAISLAASLAFAEDQLLKHPRVIMDVSAVPIDHQSDLLWTPDQRMVDELETRLEAAIAKFAKLDHQHLATTPSNYGRQYQGVIQKQKKLIYVNGFCNSHGLSESKLKLQFVDVMDGGTCYFQALYDPTTGEFVSFRFNGEA